VQDTDQRHFQRRATDTPPNSPTLIDIMQKLLEIQQKQAEHSNAFLLNDLGKPDIDGHRIDHKELKEAKKVVDSYKIEATKKFISVAIGVLCTLIGMGILDWVKTH